MLQKLCLMKIVKTKHIQKNQAGVRYRAGGREGAHLIRAVRHVIRVVWQGKACDLG